MKATLKENGKVIVEFDLGQIEEDKFNFKTVKVHFK